MLDLHLTFAYKSLMTDIEPTFEDTVKSMKALSASLRSRGEALITRADKVDAAVLVMEEENLAAKPPGASVKKDAEDTSALTPARGVTDKTIKMMAFILKKESVPVADIQAYLETLGEVNYDSLRSQLSSFADKGWLKRVRKGVYQATRLGAEKCGLKYEIPHA